MKGTITTSLEPRPGSPEAGERFHWLVPDADVF
jgi:hypothetical protein